MSQQTNHQSTESLQTLQLLLNGRVQGIGLRPAVARWARELGLAGSIRNTRQGVELLIEGPSTILTRFEDELSAHLPDEAELQTCERKICPFHGFTEFEIIHSDASAVAEAMAARVPVDRAACPDCLSEVVDSENRRSGYPFTSCTNCGPRYSLIRSMPYERPQTAMAEFPLCETCRVEYEDASDRRFHAQTNACAVCGPRAWLTDSHGNNLATGKTVISTAVAALRQGKVLGLCGLGGYQLIVDAQSQQAVETLRIRKQRRRKPLAVMVASLEQAESLVWLSEAERRELSRSTAPIVLLTARTDSGVASNVNPGLNQLGVMLPTTPLHWLLLQQFSAPLVVTSANLEGDPLAYRSADIDGPLRSVADLWLEHDRPIERPIDDSVVRCIADRRVSIRLARGFAPATLDLVCDEPLIALGGHQKTALALSNGYQCVLGPHIGDLDNLAACERYQEQYASLQQLYGVERATLVCDAHPDYFTARWGTRQKRPVESVQHHHAHIVAGMLEQGWLDREVLGVAFDGTGLGDDQTIWGGEFLLATATDYERVAHLKPFRLPGGEQAIREPWRVAVSLVAQSAGLDAVAPLKLTAQVETVLKLMNSQRLSPITTSAGRLFDGVAALILGITDVDYAGEAAMMLESVCDRSETGWYEIPIQAGTPRQLDWRPLIRTILADKANQVAPAVMAMRFHRGLARAVSRLCQLYATTPIVLGGGVFQNRCLVESIVEESAHQGQLLGLPGMIPPNDGGLAAGQLAVAVSRLKRKGTR